MQTITFDNKFIAKLNEDGSIKIDAINDASAMELIDFRASFTQRIFELAMQTHHSSDKSLPADAQVEFAENASIQLADNKYEIGRTADGHVVALRYGEPWRDCVGDNLIAALLDYALSMEEASATAQDLARQIDIMLNGEANAAQSPSLCDIVSQLQGEYMKSDAPILKRLQFNALSAAQAERLFLLAEERAESIQAIAKILRHGYESYNPNNPALGNNRCQLEREEGDGMAAMDLLCRSGDLKIVNMTEHAVRKQDHVQQYLHHQPSKGDAR